jgi:probable F420-dependent oxidoreductase
MKIDATLPPVSLKSVPEIARAAEEIGFEALWSTETLHDPFLPGALIAEHTQRLGFGTAVAIAFARSPANLAYTSWDLAQSSNGRFILGLGTQVKAHIERRYGMSWPDSVVGKLREQVEAIRAFWKTWQTGERLDFHGDFYKLSLMSPFFNPGPIQHPDIPIYIAGVNTGLARLASEAADGFLVHPFHTHRYLKEVLIPTIEHGLSRAEKPRDGFKISATVFVVTSPEEDSFVRAQIAFYASTPSYKTVMALHGWEDVSQRLSNLARQGQWGEMPTLINDQILSEVAIVCKVEELPRKLLERYQNSVDRLGLYLPFTPGERDPFWRDLLAGVKSDG